ncbi:MAG: hypothetical protein U9R00_02120 [Patescibacteria group bacterium]|nr:hypothetical protein [Patescibacteria group bacterium]
MKKSKTIAIILTILLIPVLGMAAKKAKGNMDRPKTNSGIQTTSTTGIGNSELKQKRNLQSLKAQDTEDTKEETENDIDLNNGNQNRIQLNKENEETGSTNAIQRRSRVANVVQAMLQVSERNEGIGKQIRVIAQNQNKEMEEIEEDLQSVKQRNKFLRFLIGPKYGQIKSIEERLEENSGRLEELIALKEGLLAEDVEIIDAQIQAMKEIKEELLTELNLEESGFTLFGWLVKLFN